jgi:hypothetical protein
MTKTPGMASPDNAPTCPKGHVGALSFSETRRGVGANCARRKLRRYHFVMSHVALC